MFLYLKNSDEILHYFVVDKIDPKKLIKDNLSGMVFKSGAVNIKYPYTNSTLITAPGFEGYNIVEGYTDATVDSCTYKH